MITKYYLAFGEKNHATGRKFPSDRSVNRSDLADYQKLSLTATVAIELSYL